MYGSCATAQPATIAADRRRRGVAGRLEALAPLEPQRDQAGNRRADHAGEPGARGEAVVEARRVGVGNDQRRRSRRRPPPRPSRAPARGTRSTRSGSPRRSASAPRNTAARCAPLTTASTPMKMGSAPVQLPHGSPAALPTGTSPDGDRARRGAEEERHEHGRQRERRAERARLADRGRLALQRERPAAQHDAERREEQRHRERRHDRAEGARGTPSTASTSTKISQTWFASHTGAIARLIIPADRRAALGAAGREVPEARAEVGAAEHDVGGQPDQREHRGDVGAASGAHPRTSLRPSRRSITYAMPARAR